MTKNEKKLINTIARLRGMCYSLNVMISEADDIEKFICEDAREIVEENFELLKTKNYGAGLEIEE